MKLNSTLQRFISVYRDSKLLACIKDHLDCARLALICTRFT